MVRSRQAVAGMIGYRAKADGIHRPAVKAGGVLAVLIASVYVILATVQLGAQGVFYDELHQATAAFAYVGKSSEMFSWIPVFDLPLLNMSYTGALKSAIYGIYLLITDAGFSVVSWRLTGVLAVWLGLCVLGVWMTRTCGLRWFVVFMTLFVSDTSILIMTRHDWGPVAFAVALRLLLITIWISSEVAEKAPTRASSFWCSVIVGLSVFEKLSSIVLVPVMFLLLLSPRRRPWYTHATVAAVGFCVGAAGLIAANGLSVARTRALVSLEDLSRIDPSGDLGALIVNYLMLGSGLEVKRVVLGVNDSLLAVIDLSAWLATLALLLVSGVLAFRRSHLARAGVVLLSAYCLTPFALYLLPKTTRIHHWILGSPFQYLALVAILICWAPIKPLRPWRTVHWLLHGVIIVFIAVRIVSLVYTERYLLEGRYSPTWHPELTALGEFARSQSKGTAFVVTDWGYGTQIYCFSDGEADVLEPFWDGLGIDEVELFVDRTGAETVYVVYGAEVTVFSCTESLLAEIVRRGRWRRVDCQSASAWNRVRMREFAVAGRGSPGTEGLDGSGRGQGGSVEPQAPGQSE